MESTSGAIKQNTISTNVGALSLVESFGTRLLIRSSRRKAYIFNNQTFDSRSMSQFPNNNSKDKTDIGAILRYLAFEVTVYNDLRMGELRKRLREVSSANHDNTDCLIIVVMTSGRQDFLYAKDDEYPVATLWDGFVGDGCPTLAGKPKLFFIQARMVDSRPESRRDAQRDIDYTIPSMADVMVMYSYYYEHTINNFPQTTGKEGTVFIQSLCNEFYANGHKKELLEMLTAILRIIKSKHGMRLEITQLVSDGNAAYCIEQPSPIIVSTLTKNVYFPVSLKG